MKKMYTTPKIEFFTPRIEKGFAGSGNRELFLGSEEGVGDNGGIIFEEWNHQYQPRLHTC